MSCVPFGPILSRLTDRQFVIDGLSAAPKGRKLIARGVSPWMGERMIVSPKGAKERDCRPFGARFRFDPFQGLTPLAIDCRPSGPEKHG